MTLFVLEGPSASGKSTVRDRLIKNDPQRVMWKGENLMRKGPGDDWKAYQRRYHEALHRLYELNPENTIIADRAFTDIAYNSSPEFRAEMKRLAACYGNVHILFFAPIGGVEADPFDPEAWLDARKVAEDALKDRGSRDMPQLREIWQRYGDMLQMFDHTVIDTSLQVHESVQEAEEYIANVDEEHNPDI